MDKKYYTVLVIGNGFDLNLGLKTSYKDFIDSPYFQNLLNDRNVLCEYLKEKERLHKWIDIENELKIYSKNPNLISGRGVFYNEFKDLTESLNNYINSIDCSQINSNSMAYKMLKKLVKDKTDVLIIDFNYTDTATKILLGLGIANAEGKVIKVHGSAKNKTIILGVEDGADIREDDVFLLKTVNKNYKPCRLSQKLNEANHVFFFGHSLGETDHHYFLDFFMRQTLPTNAEKDIRIVYYNEDSRLQLMKQIRKLTNSRIYELQDINSFKMKGVSE